MKKSSLLFVGLSVVALSQTACAMEREPEDLFSRRCCSRGAFLRFNRLFKRGTRRCVCVAQSEKAKTLVCTTAYTAACAGAILLLYKYCPDCLIAYDNGRNEFDWAL